MISVRIAYGHSQKKAMTMPVGYGKVLTTQACQDTLWDRIVLALPLR